MTEVAIIDYGVGNLLSVSRAFAHCGANVVVTAEPAQILAASRVVLPGVGAFANGMAALRAHGLDAVVHRVHAAGTPLLGICLGMQMMLDASQEFGHTTGLGLIPGQVVPVPERTLTGDVLKIPHIGWSGLVPTTAAGAWTDPLLVDIVSGESAYFVHSFMAKPIHADHRVADCIYGDVQISAVIRHQNVVGCQFHPEKSGEVGLRVLKNFLRA